MTWLKEGLGSDPCLDFPWQWEMGGELSFSMMCRAGKCSWVPHFILI